MSFIDLVLVCFEGGVLVVIWFILYRINKRLFKARLKEDQLLRHAIALETCKELIEDSPSAAKVIIEEIIKQLKY